MLAQRLTVPDLCMTLLQQVLTNFTSLTKTLIFCVPAPSGIKPFWVSSIKSLTPPEYNGGE